MICICMFKNGCVLNVMAIKVYNPNYMINNYLEYEYRASNKIYTHQQTGKCIHLGDISAALDVQFISKQCISTVITAAVGMEQVQYDHTINHIVYPLLDMKSENISKYFSQFYDLVEKQLAKSNILVHCAAGISRSSTLVIAYLMRKKNWSFREAIGFVRKERPNVLPNLGFERQLKEYQIYLNRQAQNGFERRLGSKTSEQRKHNNPNQKVLPEIVTMGRTQLKPKILDLFPIQQQNRFSQQRPRRSNYTRQLQKQKDELQFYGTKRMTFKPKKSKSTQQKLQRPLNLSPLYKQQSGMQKLKASLPLKHLEDMMVHRLNLNNSKKLPTQRQLRVKPLHKLAYY